ncbi:hypothetical protein Tco_0426345, partial [Tanacetum coccineum]
MNTKLNIKKLNENIVQKHGGSKQVGLKQLGSKQVGFEQLGHKQVGFKQLGPVVETGFHGVQDEKRVWFKVELQGAQGDREAEVFQQEKVYLGIKVGANIMVTGVPGQEGAEGNVAEKKKVKESMKANLRKLLKCKAWLTRRSPVQGRRHIDLESHRRDLQLEVRRERYSKSKLLFQNLQILLKDFDQGFEGLRLSSFARVLGSIKVVIAK